MHRSHPGPTKLHSTAVRWRHVLNWSPPLSVTSALWFAASQRLGEVKRVKAIPGITEKVTQNHTANAELSRSISPAHPHVSWNMLFPSLNQRAAVGPKGAPARGKRDQRHCTAPMDTSWGRWGTAHGTPNGTAWAQRGCLRTTPAAPTAKAEFQWDKWAVLLMQHRHCYFWNQREERTELWARSGRCAPPFLSSLFGENYRAVSNVRPLQCFTFQTSDRSSSELLTHGPCSKKAFS